MKRNNVAKRFGIATLCLATAISAFSGITSFATSNVAVAEETTKVAATDFVDTKTATVTQESFTSMNTGNTSTTTHNALAIRSGAAYEGTFKTVFKGNASFTYRFAEELATTIYGDFKFHIEDVTDPTNCFDLIYYARRTSSTASSNWTGFYLQYGDVIRTTSTASNYTSAVPASKIVTSGTSPINDFLPHFLCRGNKSTRRNVLSFTWDSDGVMTIKTYSAKSSNAATYAHTLAKFDGTETFTSNKTDTVWGLPKISFPNGYKVSFSSNFTKSGVADQGSDVCFSSIVNNGTTYDFNTDTEITKDDYMKEYEELYGTKMNDVLLGYKDADGNLYASSDYADGYAPVYLGFDTMNGASVRIDPTGGQSGIRFMTLFDSTEYTAASGYIQSCGTLIAYTDSLTNGDFTFENYSSEIEEGTRIGKQENTPEKRFDYTDQSGTYKAYSMALVGITDYTQTYSARGYLVVVYADETTQTFYTDYNEADNARSIAEVAYKVQQLPDYQNYTAAQKAVVDGYAEAYVAPETQE